MTKSAIERPQQSKRQTTTTAMSRRRGFGAVSLVSQQWPEGIVFGHARSSITQKERLSGIAAGTDLLKRLDVVPRHPSRCVLLQLIGVALQLGEIVEGIPADSFSLL